MTLPPLELLVAFEAAARHLSFTRAGDEIALTQSAVSRQIQALEDRLGVRAVPAPAPRPGAHRGGPRLPAGDDRSAGGDSIAPAARSRQAGETRPVVVSTTPGFAGLWLIPRLACFVAAHPEVDVRISTGNTLVNLERDGVDVAVRYRSVDAAAGGRGAAVRRDRLPGLQPAPAARRRRRAEGAGRSRQPDPAADGARRQQPAAGLGPVAARDGARPSLKPAGGAALLLVRPADPGGGRRPGRRARPGAADRPPAEGEAAGRAVRRRRASRARLLHARVATGGGAAPPRSRPSRAWLAAASTRPGFSTPARVERGLDRAHQSPAPPATCACASSSRFSAPMPCSAEIEPPQRATAS